MKFIVYAVNIHQGGGAKLLIPLLSSIVDDDDVNCVAFLDTRLELPAIVTSKIHIYKVTSSIFKRLSAELTLKQIVNPDDIVLSFGNLPPLSKLNAKTILFVQNRYLLDNVNLIFFDLKIRMRIIVERIWLRRFCKNADTIIVQTPSMKNCVFKYLGRESIVLPYIESINTFSRSYSNSIHCVEDKKYDFVYVASGEPHKNHKKLIEAWVLLADEGIYPNLCLTLHNENSNLLLKWIIELTEKYNLKIENAGFLTQSAIADLYKASRALIYPSTLESFGLPLIEARNSKLAIVASELDYVRDVLDPEETFDPSSSRSIARAVKRFLGYVESDLPLVDAKSFLGFCIRQKNEVI